MAFPLQSQNTKQIASERRALFSRLKLLAGRLQLFFPFRLQNWVLQYHRNDLGPVQGRDGIVPTDAKLAPVDSMRVSVCVFVRACLCAFLPVS